MNPQFKRALLSVSDKEGLVELARALVEQGVECVASGGTARALQSAGLPVTPVEELTGNAEAFGGRMKTLSFEIASGILFRRGDSEDVQTIQSLGIRPIDLVVVNFYPFEKTIQKKGVSKEEAVENIDIGGPTLVRAAAKNAPDTGVLTDPSQYAAFLEAFQKGAVPAALLERFAAEAFERTASYDRAIADAFSEAHLELRYGENPHQSAYLQVESDSPIDWQERVGPEALSYNNILDLSRGFELLASLRGIFPESKTVVILKHGNPCGVGCEAQAGTQSLKTLLERAWEGDPTSAFGGVLLFSHPLDTDVMEFLSDRFIEAVCAPDLTSEQIEKAWPKKKKLKAVRIRHWKLSQRMRSLNVVGGVLSQTPDLEIESSFESVTRTEWAPEANPLARFGIAITRALLSNAIAVVREVGGVFQLIGAGQGQPNRIDALDRLALERAEQVVRESEGSLKNALVVSDAFFPFPDAIEAIAKHGVQRVVQPGGSIRDGEVVEAANQHGIQMAFTGVRHFKHF